MATPPLWYLIRKIIKKENFWRKPQVKMFIFDKMAAGQSSKWRKFGISVVYWRIGVKLGILGFFEMRKTILALVFQKSQSFSKWRRSKWRPRAGSGYLGCISLDLHETWYPGVFRHEKNESFIGYLKFWQIPKWRRKNCGKSVLRLFTDGFAWNSISWRFLAG